MHKLMLRIPNYRFNLLWSTALIFVLTGCVTIKTPQEAIVLIESDCEIRTDTKSTPWEEFSKTSGLELHIIQNALIAYANNKSFKRDTIAIIDYSQPSTEKRLYVIDLCQKKLIYNTLVAHGKNTGKNIARDFSNEPESNKSSLGIFKTAELYCGNNGLSLRLDGLQKNINHNVRERLIVMHGARYVSEEFIAKYGRLGRSLGCPALPELQNDLIIRAIANGTCLYINGDRIPPNKSVASLINNY